MWKDDLSIETLEECFHVDFKTGQLTWKARPRDHFATEHGWKVFRTMYEGRSALTSSFRGKHTGALTINGRAFPLSRCWVIWALAHRAWPKEEIGHWNDNPSDDRLDNLFEQTRSEHNMRRRVTHGKVKEIGVHPTGSKFMAGIAARGKFKYLGVFDTVDEAKAARDKAALELHGVFARVGGIARAD